MLLAPTWWKQKRKTVWPMRGLVRVARGASRASGGSGLGLASPDRTAGAKKADAGRAASGRAYLSGELNYNCAAPRRACDTRCHLISERRTTEAQNLGTDGPL